MKKLILIVFAVALFFIVQRSFVLAESGCGGTEFCQSTKVVNDYECSVVQGTSSCKRTYVGSTTIDCTATQDECYGYATGTSCRYSQQTDDCYSSGRDKVSCCSGAGGGNYQCTGETQLVKECKATCADENKGARCDNNGFAGPKKWWCFTLQCTTCSATAPTNLTVSQGAQITTAVVSWTLGTGGVSQKLFAGTDKAKVEAGCPNGVGAGTGCIYSSDNATSPTEITGLSLGTIYYYRVVNYKDAACSTASATVTDLSSCELTPTSATLSPSESQVFTTSVNYSTEISRVAYNVSNPPATEVNPASDVNGADGYKTTVTALQTGNSVLTSDVYIGNDIVCTDTANVNVTATDPWWQVVDGDVTTNGNLRSSVPSGEYFGLPGAGGYPGIPSYGGSSNLSTSDVSALGWMANSSSLSSKIFNYAFFKNQIPGSIVPTDAVTGLSQTGATFFGYEWFKYTGPVDFNIDTPIDFGSRKVILLVENANLGINANINLTDGQGFFLAIVNGDINVNSSVTSLEGLYMADETFSTGTAGANSDLPLYVRGSAAAYAGVNLQRDLADDSLPAETFEYAPDQILLFPSKLGHRRMKWKEVAP